MHSIHRAADFVEIQHRRLSSQVAGQFRISKMLIYSLYWLVMEFSMHPTQKFRLLPWKMCTGFSDQTRSWSSIVM